jgi:hypothetical protein
VKEQPVSTRITIVRILVRKNDSELYLQPSGEWAESRDTAREFPQSILAYHWALQRQFQDIEIVLTFEDPGYDFPLKI